MEFVVLLRGINVGGTSKVPMAQLRDHLSASFGDVRTYIQSGNIVLTSDAAAADVAATVHDVLHDKFDVTGRVTALALSADDFRAAIAQAPEGFGGEPELYRYDVAFYVGTTTAEVEPYISTHPEADTVGFGDFAFYHRRLISMASKSRLSKIASTPVYPKLTVRNWRTSTTLVGMLGE